MSEQDNIKAYQDALRAGDASHWERGRLACEWLDLYCGERPQITYAKAVGDTQASISQHVRTYRMFYKSIYKVSWTHHLVALEECGSDSAAAPWLMHAVSEGWSVRQMADAIRASSREESSDVPLLEPDSGRVGSLEELVAKGKKFGAIYADPPWRYGNQGTRAATNNHYSTMDVAAIGALPVRELADEKCHLHLWTTNGFLKDALSLIDVWGFEFKSTFVWVKPQMGIGNYWRNSHEILLLGVKGGKTFQNKSLMSWLEADRTKHSAKPKELYEMIQRASPGPYLELFGRNLVPGWMVWGNQIEVEVGA